MIDNYEHSYVEVLEILKHIPKNEFEKIPKEKIEFYEKYKDKKYTFIYSDENCKHILRKTRAILVNLYINYIATEDEKKKIEQILKLNDQKAEIEKSKKYNPDNLFRKNTNI